MRVGLTRVVLLLPLGTADQVSIHMRFSGPVLGILL